MREALDDAAVRRRRAALVAAVAAWAAATRGAEVLLRRFALSTKWRRSAGMRAPFARWRERASTRLIATAARTAGLVAALRGATARWRALTAEAEAMDGKWQAARRHKYKQRLRTSMRGLKLALARRHAKAEANLAAEAALAPMRRRTGLHEWARRARAAREDALTLARCARCARAPPPGAPR